MSWNKYNLYNQRSMNLKFYGQTETYLGHQRLFGQAMHAKGLTRKYHGQGLTERVFKKQMFKTTFNAVAGGGNEERLIWGGLYAGIERRLDTVIYRSLFASSILQARQLIVHGHVEVNGKRVGPPYHIYPLTFVPSALDLECY